MGSAYYHVKEDKLDPRAKKGVFVGFMKGIKCYKIWDSKNKKFILSRDVMFDEASTLKSTISYRWRLRRPKEYRSKWRVMLLNRL